MLYSTGVSSHMQWRFGDTTLRLGNAFSTSSSVDGIEWTSEDSGTTAALYGVAGTGSEFIAVGASGIVLQRVCGEVVADAPDQALLPASNQKILTAAGGEVADGDDGRGGRRAARARRPGRPSPRHGTQGG